MDNFRKHKKSRVRPGPVDGFVSSAKQPARRLVKAGSTPVFNKTTNRPQIGNFKRSEGLHPTKQGRLGFGGRQPLRDARGEIAVNPETAAKKPKKVKKQRSRRYKIIKRSALSLLALLLIGTGFLGIKTYIKSRNVLAGGGRAAALTENVDPTQLDGEGDGRVNILLLGKGGSGHEAPDLTDTIIVASIDPIHKEAALVSLPRDLYVRTPASGSMKINAVYVTAKNKVLYGPKVEGQKKKAEEAGFKAIEAQVTAVLGIPIHYHTMVDFTGFKKAVDAVGGVDITVPADLAVTESMWIPPRQYYLNVKAGKSHFDGFRALAFSRTRNSIGSDFSRGERQRLVMVALKNKAFSLGTLSNPLKINQLLDAFGNHVQTNFSQSEILRVYDIGQSIDSKKIKSIGLADPPNSYLTTGSLAGQSIVLPRAGLNNYGPIQSYIRNKLRDAYLRQENATIAIYNGTSTSGLAKRTSTNLKSYGYKVSTVGDAPTKTYTSTVLVDLRDGNKKYTKHYLEKRLNTTAVSRLPEGIEPGTADFVIILGTNEVDRLAQ